MKAPLAVAVLWTAMMGGPAQSQDAPGPDKVPLAICLQGNDPPLSLHGVDQPSGFDVALSGVIAHRLGRDLRIQWFVSRDDPDASLVKDSNALLSNGRCQLLAEYPLLESTLQRPYAPTAKLPPFDGATPDDRRRWVRMNPLAATRPYRQDVLTVVLSAHAANRPVHRLADLGGLTIGVQTATLSDAIAMHYDNGHLIEHVVHLPEAHDVFDALQSGKLDAGFADLRAYDAWRERHRAGTPAPSGYVHSLGFNMGFVGLASNAALIRQVDTVLADLQAHDAVAPLASRAGLTFIPPRMPAVQPDVDPSALSGD